MPQIEDAIHDEQRKPISRGLAVLLGLLAIVLITLAFALFMGLFNTRDVQDGISPRAPAFASKEAADLYSGGVAGPLELKTDVARSKTEAGGVPLAIGGVIGTWTCSDYDYDGTTYTFQATFTDAGNIAVWLYDFEGSDDAHYAALRTFGGTDEGEVFEDGGFSFVSKEAGTLSLEVSSVNKSHQQKEEYTFTKKGAAPETLKQLSWAVGDWYAQDETTDAFYLDMNGYWYEGEEQTSNSRWYILDGKVVLEGNPEKGIGDLTLTFMGGDFDVLVDLETERMFSWNPPGAVAEDTASAGESADESASLDGDAEAAAGAGTGPAEEAQSEAA